MDGHASRETRAAARGFFTLRQRGRTGSAVGHGGLQVSSVYVRLHPILTAAGSAGILVCKTPSHAPFSANEHSLELLRNTSREGAIQLPKEASTAPRRSLGLRECRAILGVLVCTTRARATRRAGCIEEEDEATLTLPLSNANGALRDPCPGGLL